MSKRKSIIRTIIRSFFQAFRLIILLITFIIRVFFKCIENIIESVLNKLRFSIKFKITITYLLIFLLIFSCMSTAIVISFNYYIENGIKQNYMEVLSIILGLSNLFGILFTLIIGSKINKKLLSPVETMTNTVKEISIKDLDKRLDVRGSKNELKDLAKTFNDMLDRIQTSVEQQNRFVSDASHELRTPISVIQGYANLLSRWGKDDKTVLEESILAIKSESENMKMLVENLLFLARGDKNTQKFEREDFMFDDFIDEIVKETKLIDSKHPIIIEYNEKFMFNGDKKLIKQALRIFIDNSIKYTPEGKNIILNSYVKNSNAVISIDDNGIGISEEDLPFIFDRFYRADKSRTKESGGTGLGLSIAKWIIDKHNGAIDVWSKVNKGTAIRITMPLTNLNNSNL